MTRAELVTLARSYAPTAPTDPRYVELLEHPGDRAKHGAGWPERYYPDPKTYTCALTVLGLWRLAGVRSQLLTDAYRPGHATADMGSIARGAVAYHDVTDLLRDRYKPKPGDAVMIVEASGKREHAFTIVDVIETEIGWRLETVDGGHSIKAVKRVWRRGPGRIVDDVDGRLVAYVVDVGALLAASGPPGGGAGDTEPAPAPDTIPDAAPTDPAPYLLGVDVSRFQAPQDVDWATLAKTHRFAIIKASEALERDPRCVEHVTRARPHMAHLGLYMVPHQDPPAEPQVAALRGTMAAVDMDGPGHIVPCLDIEVDPARNHNGRQPAAYSARCQEIAESLGEVLIYTNPYTWHWLGHPEWMLDYPWWIADARPRDPECPVEWAIWQWCAAPLGGYNGRKPDGSPAPIDQNRARRLPIRTAGGTGYL